MEKAKLFKVAGQREAVAAGSASVAPLGTEKAGAEIHSGPADYEAEKDE